MANREQLAIIRQARAGEVASQLALAKLYLHGAHGLPQSVGTALYWFDRAARAGSHEAVLEIGRAIPFDVARQSEDVEQIWPWYQQAFAAGVMQAGLVFARLVLQHKSASAPLLHEARNVLLQAAQAGLPEAQWLLAKQSADAPGQPKNGANQHWVAQAAQGGVTEAQRVVAESAWNKRNWEGWLGWAQPIARDLAQACQSWQQAHADMPHGSTLPLQEEQVNLLVRCAQALAQVKRDPEDMVRFCELAALHGACQAQWQLGLWHARMDQYGIRQPGALGSANFKKAIRWLTHAGEQGLAEAWFALSRIYLKPEFSQRSVADAQIHLERAAELGHVLAQAEAGANAWRNRREKEENDVRALYWLSRAAAQGEQESAALLGKIAPPRTPNPWAQRALRLLSRELTLSQPFLAARIEMAAMFGLTRAECLLLDPKQADRGHCLVVDIRAVYGRSKRQLLLVENGAPRQLLDRLGRLFDDVDCSASGPEGNYRQRLYRLKTSLPQLAEDEAETV